MEIPNNSLEDAAVQEDVEEDKAEEEGHNADVVEVSHRYPCHM